MPACSSNAPRVEPDELEAAVAILRRGGLVVYPTETLYGLGADALDRTALRRLVMVKGREPGKPIAVLVDGEAMLDGLIEEIPARARQLMRRFWPGPLTLVLPARASVAEELTGGSGTIGARVSSCAVATELVRRLGRPLTAPSANPAGQAPPRTSDAAYEYFGSLVDCYLDGGTLPGEPASTVVAVRGDALEVLRAGVITAEELEAC